MFPFDGRESKRQRNWASVSSLGGLLLVAIGLSNTTLPPIFLGMNTITFVGAIAFIFGIIYLIDAVSK